MELLSNIAKYLAAKLGMTVATDVFYYEEPDMPDVCVMVTEPKQSYPVIAQINASSHFICIRVRALNNTAAAALANSCFRWLLSDENDIETANKTGFITLSDECSVYIHLHGEPLWEKTDQRARKYFVLTCTIITEKNI